VARRGKGGEDWQGKDSFELVALREWLRRSSVWIGQARLGEVRRGEARCGHAGQGTARRGRARRGRAWHGEDSFELVAVP
jgi:hypothetical protein